METNVLDKVTGKEAIESAPLMYSSGQVVAVTELRAKYARAQGREKTVHKVILLMTDANEFTLKCVGAGEITISPLADAKFAEFNAELTKVLRGAQKLEAGIEFLEMMDCKQDLDEPCSYEGDSSACRKHLHAMVVDLRGALQPLHNQFHETDSEGTDCPACGALKRSE